MSNHSLSLHNAFRRHVVKHGMRDYGESSICTLMQTRTTLTGNRIPRSIATSIDYRRNHPPRIELVGRLRRLHSDAGTTNALREASDFRVFSRDRPKAHASQHRHYSAATNLCANIAAGTRMPFSRATSNQAFIAICNSAKALSRLSPCAEQYFRSGASAIQQPSSSDQETTMAYFSIIALPTPA